MANRQPVQIVQAGLGVTPDRGIIQSLWVEIPANCDLRCPYCFCATPRDHRDNRPANLALSGHGGGEYSADLYVSNILEPFARGIDSWNDATPERRSGLFHCPPENTASYIRGAVAIPGAGEPFHPFNFRLVRKLIDACGRLGLHLTIFTTAHWIDDDLAAELAERDIVLLVKYNSGEAAVQNELVGLPPTGWYFDRRKHALDRLVRCGFNRPFRKPGEPGYQPTRLGIVTSIMKANLGELPGLLRFARRNNMVFDCDTILERGRGFQCSEIPGDEETKNEFLKLQEIDSREFQNQWNISRSYVGTVCDRFRHHLYIDCMGQISPCVGSVDLELGNVRNGPEELYAAWNRPVMKDVIRKRQYAGACPTCANWVDESCLSCLGRCRDMTVPLSREDSDQLVPTVKCWNFRPLQRDSNLEV